MKLIVAPRVPRPDKSYCRKAFHKLYFYTLEYLWIVISNHFLLYRTVIPKELRIWPKSHLFSLILSFHSHFSHLTLIKFSFPNSQIFHFKLSHVLFSVTLTASSASSVSSKLLDWFCCAKKATYHEVLSFTRNQYKREVYYERTFK